MKSRTQRVKYSIQIPSFYFWNNIQAWAQVSTLQHFAFWPQLSFDAVPIVFFVCHCLSICALRFWVPNRPQNLLNTSICYVHFWNPCFWDLETLPVPLGNLLEPLMLVLGASKTRKVLFLHWEIQLFVNVVFRYVEALDVLLGSILVLLGPL